MSTNYKYFKTGCPRNYVYLTMMKFRMLHSKELIPLYRSRGVVRVAKCGRLR